MRITGVATMHAPVGEVWTALNDPAVLVATIPGCERLESAGADTYRFVISAGVASIQGVYTGQVSLSEQQEPTSFVLAATGAGGPGTVTTRILIRLASTGDGWTELNYDADAVVAGLIAGVGQLLLATVAKRLADEFFAAVDGVLAGKEIGSAQPDSLGILEPGSVADDIQAGVYLPPAAGTSGTPANRSFGAGMAVGAAVALAGVAVGKLFGRRPR